jgi:hypothetical protein
MFRIYGRRRRKRRRKGIAKQQRQRQPLKLPLWRKRNRKATRPSLLALLIGRRLSRVGKRRSSAF